MREGGEDFADVRMVVDGQDELALDAAEVVGELRVAVKRELGRVTFGFTIRRVNEKEGFGSVVAAYTAQAVFVLDKNTFETVMEVGEFLGNGVEVDAWAAVARVPKATSVPNLAAEGEALSSITFSLCLLRVNYHVL